MDLARELLRRARKTATQKENPYDTGMGTTPDMWEILSDVLAEDNEKLPISLNNAIYALRDGKAMVVEEQAP
jgi:hypothetical protein